MNDSGETNLQGRTGSVSSRWWETPAEPTAPLPPPAPLPPVESVGGRSRFAPPPPPPPAWLNVGPDQATADAAAVHRLERELAAAREEVAAARAEVGALHEMLEDLPAIFERKFRQRLQGILEQQQLLLLQQQLEADLVGRELLFKQAEDAIAAALADPALYTRDPAGLKELQAKLSGLEDGLARAMQRWEDLESQARDGSAG